MSNSTEVIAERIDKTRRDLDISTAELARDTNLARTSLQRKLAGVQPFNTKELAAISKRFGATLEESLTEWFRGL